MNPFVFNACILIGWLMVLVGSCMASISIGLFFSGLLMVVLVLIVAHVAGVFAPRRGGDDS